MDHVGIDVHKRESQLCMLNPEGEVTEVRISTTRERFRAVLGDQPRAKVLIESSVPGAFLTVREAARRLKVSTETVYKAAHGGR